MTQDMGRLVARFAECPVDVGATRTFWCDSIFLRLVVIEAVVSSTVSYRGSCAQEVDRRSDSVPGGKWCFIEIYLALQCADPSKGKNFAEAQKARLFSGGVI